MKLKYPIYLLLFILLNINLSISQVSINTSGVEPDSTAMLGQ